MFVGVALQQHECQSSCQYPVGSFVARAQQAALMGKEAGRSQPTEMSELWGLETLAGLLDRGGLARGLDSPRGWYCRAVQDTPWRCVLLLSGRDEMTSYRQLM